MKSKKTHKHGKKRRFFPSGNLYKLVLIGMAVIAIFFLISITLADALPDDLTFVLIAVMLAMLLAASTLFASRKKYKRIMGVLVAVLFAAAFSFMTGFMGKTYAMLSKISDAGIEATGPVSKSVDVTDETFNIYITGIDQWASDKGLDLERSDVNMLVTVNPSKKEVMLTSIPRDTYVKLHTMQQMDKLTHTGVYGVDETLNTVQDWLGIEINYYVKINFTGARDIIDAMGGIDVYSPVAFHSSLKGYRYVKGWNHLRGKTAIYFARERKAFEGQDSVRVENQQRVLKAMIKKMTSSTTLLTKYGSIMDAAGEQMQTNLSTYEMRELVKMQITDLASWDVKTQKIEGEYDEDYVASLTQSRKFSIYRANEASVERCKQGIAEVMNKGGTQSDKKLINKSNKSFFVNLFKRALNMNETDRDE